MKQILCKVKINTVVIEHNKIIKDHPDETKRFKGESR